MEEMTMRAIRAASGLAVAMAVCSAGWTQTAPQDKKPDAATPCVAAAKDAASQNCTTPANGMAPAKDAGQKFPFPGEAPATPTRPADWGPDVPAPTDSAAPAQAKKPAGLPAYPGDPDAPAATPADGKKPGAPFAYPGDPDAPAATKDDGFSSSSSSSSSGGPADGNPEAPDGPLADAGSSGDTTRVPISHRKKLPKVNPETPESRAAEDLTVAEFYQNDGNYKGAYDRAKDAVQYQPNDPYTHFALAEAARKLGKIDEAKVEYAAVLRLDPIPKQMKESKRALTEMAGK